MKNVQISLLFYFAFVSFSIAWIFLSIAMINFITYLNSLMIFWCFSVDMYFSFSVSNEFPLTSMMTVKMLLNVFFTGKFIITILFYIKWPVAFDFFELLLWSCFKCNCSCVTAARIWEAKLLALLIRFWLFLYLLHRGLIISLAKSKKTYNIYSVSWHKWIYYFLILINNDS